MFEDKGKMVCLNCDYECSKFSAKNARHEHSYVSYQGSRPHPTSNFSHVEAPRVTPQAAAYNRSHATTSTQKTSQNTKPKGCSSLVFIIFIVYILFMFFGGLIGILD